MSYPPHPYPPQIGDSLFIHSRGVRLHTVSAGNPEGELLIFLHGFGGGYFDWLDFFSSHLLLSRYHLLAVDMRGYGLSDKTPHGYDLTTAASDICGLIRSLGHSSAHVIGHGEGGLIGWTMAAIEPERVITLVTISSAHPLVQAASMLSRPWTHRRIWAETLFLQIPSLPEWLLKRKDGSFLKKRFLKEVAPGHRHTEAVRSQAEYRRQSILGTKVAHLATEYRRWTVRSRLRSDGAVFNSYLRGAVSLPVLSIHGSMDPFYDKRCAEASTRRGAQGSRSHLLFGVGHYPHIEAPEEVIEVIAQFYGVEL